MRINADNIDEFYDKVNTKLDTYFGKGIEPTSLKKYFKKDGYGIKRFIDREEFSDIEGIERVITDCVDDRVAALGESIMTFENYNQKNNFDISFGIDDEQEASKILADFYNTSLGHVELDYNVATIKGIGLNKEVIIFQVEHLAELFIQISSAIYENFVENSFKYPMLELEFDLEKLVDRGEFEIECHKLLSENENENIEKLLLLNTGDKYKYVFEKNEIIIFEKMS